MLADFALGLMSSLDKFNRNSFNLFKLRIGLYASNSIIITITVIFYPRQRMIPRDDRN